MVIDLMSAKSKGALLIHNNNTKSSKTVNSEVSIVTTAMDVIQWNTY